MAGLWQRGPDYEPAERLGRGQARRAAGCRAMLDARLPVRPEGPLCTLPALFLERVEFLQEQGGGQEPADASVAAGCCREAGGGERWLRSSGVRKADHPEDMGRGRPAEGNAVPLSESLQSPEALDLGIAGAAENRPADLHAGNPDQDVRAFLPG